MVFDDINDTSRRITQIEIRIRIRIVLFVWYLFEITSYHLNGCSLTEWKENIRKPRVVNVKLKRDGSDTVTFEIFETCVNSDGKKRKTETQ